MRVAVNPHTLEAEGEPELVVASHSWKIADEAGGGRQSFDFVPKPILQAILP